MLSRLTPRFQDGTRPGRATGSCGPTEAPSPCLYIDGGTSVASSSRAGVIVAARRGNEEPCAYIAAGQPRRERPGVLRLSAGTRGAEVVLRMRFSLSSRPRRRAARHAITLGAIAAVILYQSAALFGYELLQHPRAGPAGPCLVHRAPRGDRDASLHRDSHVPPEAVASPIFSRRWSSSASKKSADEPARRPPRHRRSHEPAHRVALDPDGSVAAFPAGRTSGPPYASVSRRPLTSRPLGTPGQHAAIHPDPASDGRSTRWCPYDHPRSRSRDLERQLEAECITRQDLGREAFLSAPGGER